MDRGQKRLRRRVANVMQREMICSEHGALCFLEAQRRERTKVKAQLATASPYDCSGAALKEYPGE